MGQTLQNVNLKMKQTTKNAFVFVVRLFSGLILGLVFSLVGQEIFNYGTFSFVLVSVITVGLFLYKSKRWSLVSVLVFDLICVLCALLLRMYILVAPGA